MRGFTLIEIVIAVAVLGVIAGIISISLQNALDRQRLNEAVEESISLIQKAREWTLSSQGGTSGEVYGIRVKSADGELELRRFDTTPQILETYELRNGFTIVFSNKFKKKVGMACPSNMYDEIYFERLSGIVKVKDGSNLRDICGTSGNYFDIVSGQGETRRITIKPTGVVEVTNP